MSARLEFDATLQDVKVKSGGQYGAAGELLVQVHVVLAPVNDVLPGFEVQLLAPPEDNR